MIDKISEGEKDFPDLKSVLKSFEDELDANAKEATKKILNILSKTELLDLIIMYETRGGKRISADKWIDEDRNKKPKCKMDRRVKLYAPKRELKAIKQSLEKLTWLSDNHCDEILKFIKFKLASTKMGKEYISELVEKEALKTGGRHKANPALDVLLIDLVRALERKTGKRQYRLIAEFLEEQQIIRLADAASIKTKIERIIDNSDSLLKSLNARPDLILLRIHLFKLSSQKQADIPDWLQEQIISAFE